MTIKDKKGLVELLNNRFRNDINNLLDELYEKDDISNFDANMKKIIQSQQSVKTIKDLIDLEELYYKIEHWFEVLEKEYILEEALEAPINLAVDKDSEVDVILNYFSDKRTAINKKLKAVDASFIFKDFHDYVDKVWEEM